MTSEIDPPRAGRVGAVAAELQALSGRRVVRVVALVAASLLAFLIHFRPWQAGLLEEWGLELEWQTRGFDAYFDHLEGTLGRPLNLLPYFAGLSASGGGFVGMYAILGIVAALQFLGTTWAIRPIITSFSTRWGLALLIGLHPWWPAGDVLRFMAAQIVVLSMILWFGAVIRWVGRTGAAWGVVVAGSPVVGLLFYEGPAAAWGLWALLVPAVLGGRPRRRVLAGSVTIGAIGLVVIWSAVIAPRASPDSYEASLSGNGLEVLSSVRAILRTLWFHSPAVVVFGAIVAVLITVLMGTRVMTPSRGITLLAAVGLSPLAALSYALFPLHLRDPERVELPIGLVLWMVLGLVSIDLALLRRWGALVAVATACVAVIGGLFGYHEWSGYARSQQALLRGIQELRATLPEDDNLVIADLTGKYGDVYMLLPPYLNIALDSEFGAGADAVLCTADGVERDHPVASVYPLDTTVDCSTLIDPDSAGPIDVLEVPGGHVDVYVNSQGSSS